MTLEQYQREMARTINRDTFDNMLTNAAMGLCGEAGECCDIVKKYRFQKHELNKEKLIEELGDTAWYLAFYCFVLDVSMSEVLEKNIEKLKKRYSGEGFSAEESVHRDEYTLTRQDLNEYSAEHLSMAAMLHNALIKTENGVNILEYTPELRIHATVVDKRIQDIETWINERKGKQLTLRVRVTDGV